MLSITELPKAEHDGPTMFARIAMMRALHRGRPKPTPTPRKGEDLPERAVMPSCDGSPRRCRFGTSLFRSLLA